MDRPRRRGALFGGATARERSGGRASHSLTRDRLAGDNALTLLLDTFNDEETAVEFTTTPAGILVDRAIENDGQSSNDSWNAFWDAATTRTATGWTAEMRIPFSSLRVEVGAEGRVEMGLMASRFIAKSAERATFPVLSPRFSSAQQRPSLARTIVLRDVVPRAPLYVSPYGLTGHQRDNRPNEPGTGFDAHTVTSLEVGGDLKWSPSPNLAVDLTVNTDFAQVEADDQQVNLTRFSLFYPEKRQSFQERAGTFSFDTGDGRVFHSRRIGLDPTGRALRIDGGGRVVGRASGWDFGLIDMQAEDATGDGSENLGVFRVRRSVGKAGSYVGGIVTSRLGPGGDRASYGVDAQVRAFGNDYLTAQWSQSSAPGLDFAGSESGLARLRYERRSNQGLVYAGELRRVGAAYAPELGFAPRNDYTYANANLRYGWFPGEATAFTYIEPSLNVSSHWGNPSGDEAGHELETRSANLYLNYALKVGYGGFLVASSSYERLPFDLQLGGGAALVPEGVHEWQRLGAYLFASDSHRYRFDVTGSLGSFYDGTMWTASFAPSTTLSEHLDLGFEYNWSRIHFEERGQSLNADIARLRATVAVNRSLSGAAFVQYNHAANVVAVNGRIRYRFSEGRDLWLVINDQVNKDLHAVPALELPRSQRRAIALKYIHTFAR